VEEQQAHGGQTHRFRRVMQVTGRTGMPGGQLLLVSDIEIEGW